MSARILLNEAPRRLDPRGGDWPRQLHELSEPPEQLFVAGQLPALDHAVAIVGTRYADEEACRFTRQLARDLAAAGVVVISGGAAGIDGEAHRGALEAGGRTLAILALGLGHAYPAHHAPLFAEIARSGALLCETAQKPSPAGGFLFLRRNRLIAALAGAVVVVQAPYKSGALSTAHEAQAIEKTPVCGSGLAVGRSRYRLPGTVAHRYRDLLFCGRYFIGSRPPLPGRGEAHAQLR